MLSNRHARERLLEGFLLRLAASRDADAFALRGGMLVRTWNARRPIRDADLVCSLPWRPRAMRTLLGAVLANREIADGVVFDADRFRVDTLRPQSSLKLFAAGEVDGELAEMTVDFTFDLDVWPASTRGVMSVARGAAQLWMCPHELVIGTKLRVIAELGPRQWRPKDLGDIWLALRRFPPARSFGVLGEAIERCFAGSGHDVTTLLDRPWWHERRAQMRWGRYHDMELAAVIAEVRAQLSPLARQP